MENLGLIIAISAATVSIVGVMMALMFWCRQEGNTLRTEAREDRKDFMQLNRNMEKTLSAIQDEMRDFHHRLLDIERSRKNA